MEPRAKRNRKVIMAAAAMTILILIAIVVANNANNTNKPASAQRTATISITSAGYNPAEAHIKVNTKVTWSNTDNQGHTVGANPYPSHSSLPGLVSDALIKGQSYSYTFSKAGTYYYHDDLNPTLNAKIIVQD